MSEQPSAMICYACNALIPMDTPMHDAVRLVRDRRGRERRFDDQAVLCPRHGDRTRHPPSTGYNWVSKALHRGRDLLRRIAVDEERRRVEAVEASDA